MKIRMSCIAVLFAGTTLTSPSSAQVAGFEVPNDPTTLACQLEQSRLKPRLAALVKRYRALGAHPSIRALVDMDTRLRALLDSRRELCANDVALYAADFAQLGLKLGYWQDLGYSGKLLACAHRINPHSPYRRYTLYSLMASNDVNAWSWLGVGPQPDEARQYLREFPQGPFAGDAERHLGAFYRELYMALRERKIKGEDLCPAVGRYLTREAIPAQRRRVQLRALAHYRKAFAIKPPTPEERELLAELEAGTTQGWSFCAD